MKKRTIIFFVLLMVPVYLLVAYTQWEDGGKAIRKETNLNWEGTSVELNDGSSVIVWNDAASGDQLIKMQRFDIAGNIMWSSDGVIIADDSGRPHAYRLVKDNQDNIFLGWVEDDLESGWLQLSLQKIDNNGSMLWSNKRILLENCWDYVDSYVMINDEADGLFVAWNDQEEYGLHLQGDGELVEGWISEGITLHASEEERGLPIIANDGEGGIITCSEWSEYPISKLYMQRTSGAGETIWDEDLEIMETLSTIHVADFLVDSFGDIIIVYGKRIGDQKELNARKLDIDGNFLWDEPLQLYTGVSILHSLHLIETDPGNYIATWGGTAQTVSSDYIAVTKFNTDAEICWESSFYQEAEWTNLVIDDLISNGDGGAWIIINENNYEAKTLKLQRLNADGDFELFNDGIIIRSRESYIESASFCHQGNDGVLLCWMDGRDSEQSLYVQKVNDAEVIQLSDSGESRYSQLGGNTYGFQAVGDEEYTFIIWVDNRYNDQEQVYLQVVDNESGEFLFSENGIAITEPYTDICEMKATYLEDSNMAGLIWINRFEDRPLIQVVDLAGNRLCGESGMPLILEEGFVMYNTESLSISSCGNGFNTMWQYQNGDIFGERQITIQRVENGQLIWGENGINIESEPMGLEFDLMVEEVISDYFICYGYIQYPIKNYYVLRYNADGTLPEGWTEAGIQLNDLETIRELSLVKETNEGLLCIWNNDQDNGGNTYGQLISENGYICWEENGKLLMENDEIRFNFAVAQVEDGFYLTYKQANSEEDISLMLEKLDYDGNRIWEDAVAVFSNVSYYQSPQLLANDEVISVYLPNADPQNELHDIYAKFYHPDGTIWEGISEEGIIISDELYCQRDLQLHHDDQNDYLVWEDERGQKYSPHVDPSIYMQKISLPVVVSSDENNLVNFVEITNYPNPFVGNTQLSYSLPRSEKNAEIEIYNVKGQLVRKISAEKRGASWDCRDIKGRHVGSGVYFYRLIGAGIESKTQKMIMLR